jgi:acyl-CoA reductase-like NAD-dependent aldehyde dehydrogenase
MTIEIANIIAGRRQAPRGNRRYRAINPSETSDLIAEYPLSAIDDVAEAVAAARAAAPGWARESPIARGEILMKAGALMRGRVATFAELAAREIGKPIGEASGEARSSSTVRKALGCSAKTSHPPGRASFARLRANRWASSASLRPGTSPCRSQPGSSGPR